MNTTLGICPNCKVITNIQLVKYKAYFQCNCGYYNSVDIKECIHLFQTNNLSKVKTKNKEFTDFTYALDQGINHLNTYFKSIKNYHINQLLMQINQIESAYENSYERNNNILSLLRLLYTNYKKTAKIYLYKCDNSMNLNSVLTFYKDYNINEFKERKAKPKGYYRKISFTIKSYTVNFDNIIDIKTIQEHKKEVNSLLLLKNQKIASCSDDKTIKIFEPSNDYHFEQIQKTQCLKSFCQLEDGTIITCSKDGSITIGEYLINYAHNDTINKIIPLPEHRIASCSNDKSIKIWKTINYDDAPIKILKGHNGSVTSLLYIKERNILISGSIDETLILWNATTYHCVMVIKADCLWNNALYQLDKDRVIVGHFNGFSIINIDKGKIEKDIDNEEIGRVCCFLKLRDKNTIICGCEKGQFCYYDIKAKTFTIKQTSHNNTISDILELNNDTFITCSLDSTIKVWNY